MPSTLATIGQQLEQALTTNERLQRDKEIYIEADETVPYGFVAKVMALVRRGGIEKVGLVTDPTGSGEAEPGAPPAE